MTAVGFVGLGTMGSALSGRLLAAGADHVVYDTDYTFDMAAGRLADQLAGTGLAPADAELIAGRNAAALFGVPGRPAVRW